MSLILIADDSASFAEMIVQTVDHGPSPFSLRVLAEGASWQRRILPVVDRLEMWHGSRL